MASRCGSPVLPGAASTEVVVEPCEPVGLAVREVTRFDDEPRHQLVTTVLVHHEGEAGLGELTERPAVVVPARLGPPEPDGVRQSQVCQIATGCGEDGTNTALLYGRHQDARLACISRIGDSVVLGYTDELDLRSYHFALFSTSETTARLRCATALQQTCVLEERTWAERHR